MGEVFTPDKLLAGSVAAVIGLNVGGVIVDGFIGGTTKALSYVTQKLVEDIEKINYEIFYKELKKLDTALKDFDKVIEAANKAEELIHLKEKITPLFNEKVGSEEINVFIEKVSCHPSFNELEKATVRSKLSDLIERFKGPEFSMRKLCFQLSKMDELESKIDSIGRLLSAKFNDMREYRLRKVEEEAENEFDSWVERVG